MSNKVIDITILYEDKDCAVINKPAGFMVHPDGRAGGPFISDWVTAKYPEAVGVGEPGRDLEGKDLNRSGIVHRLDRETSGVLVIARTAEGYANLKKQFQDHTIVKKYLTFIWGKMKEEFGTIDRPIGRSGSDFRKRSSARGMRGEPRDAETYWTRLWAGECVEPATINTNTRLASLPPLYSFLEVEPKTGRTHQIRVHLNSTGHPVVGDILYAARRPMVLGFERLALHSRSLEFKTVDGKVVKVTAPLPPDFENACKMTGIEVKGF